MAEPTDRHERDEARAQDTPAAERAAAVGRPLAWWMPSREGWAAAGGVPADSSTPRLAPGGRDLRGELHAFVARLRATGLHLPMDRVVVFCEAAAALSPVQVQDVYWAGRATLLAGPGAVPAYDAAFRAHFVGVATSQQDPEAAQDPDPHTVWVDRPGADDGDDHGTDEPQPGAVASAHEYLRHRRFDEATDEELAAMRRLMARIELVVPVQRHRRLTPGRHGRSLDVRRSIRRAMRTDGELLTLLRRRHRVRQRPLVMVLDVSGSMADHSRALLQFAFTARVRARRVEVFAFSTRLTRLTRQLEASSVDAALDRAAAQVHDWDSGTRIGEALDALLRRWGRRGMVRGAVVVLVSDGLERGDIDLLSRSMARLHRQAHAVVWVNPLKADPRYEPLARGMAAAMPHIDHLVTGHDLASLDALAEVVASV